MEQIGDDLTLAGDDLYPRRMVGPLLLTREAESIRRSLVKWVSAYRIRGEDYTLDEHGNRVYEVSKLPPLVNPLLEVMGLQVRQARSTQHRNHIDQSRGASTRCFERPSAKWSPPTMHPS